MDGCEILHQLRTVVKIRSLLQIAGADSEDLEIQKIATFWGICAKETYWNMICDEIISNYQGMAIS